LQGHRRLFWRRTVGARRTVSIQDNPMVNPTGKSI
jgi:hypothetical protein